MTDLLAVYGTLRPGGRWHGHIVGWPIVTEQATVAGHLVDTGNGYPGLIPGGQRVVVTVVRIPPNGLTMLDRFEDIRPGRGEYRRVRTIARAGEAHWPVWIYRYRGVGHAIISSGDWLRTIAGSRHAAAARQIR